MAHNGDVIADYFNPQNLTFTLNKGENGPHDISYEVSRSQGLVYPGFIGNDTDFELWRGDTKIMTGMVTAFNISSNQESVQISGKSYLHYLSKRFWDFDASDIHAFQFKLGLTPATANDPPQGFSYFQRDVEVMQIVKDLLDMVLLDDNSLDFTYVLPAIDHTIHLFSVGWPDTEDILSKITTLSQEEPGEFDFWMDVNKVFRIAAPRQYDLDVYNDESLAEHVFDSSFPETGFHEISFSNTGPQFTWLLGQGASTSPTVASTRQYLPGSEQFRRLDGYVSYPDVLGQTRVDNLTRRKLLFGLNPIHEVTLTVMPERVNNFWTRFSPGKAIWVKADLEGWKLDAAMEIVSMDCSPDLDGNEPVTFKLNQIYQSEGINVD